MFKRKTVDQELGCDTDQVRSNSDTLKIKYAWTVEKTHGFFGDDRPKHKVFPLKIDVFFVLGGMVQLIVWEDKEKSDSVCACAVWTEVA